MSWIHDSMPRFPPDDHVPLFWDPIDWTPSGSRVIANYRMAGGSLILRDYGDFDLRCLSPISPDRGCPQS